MIIAPANANAKIMVVVVGEATSLEEEPVLITFLLSLTKPIKCLPAVMTNPKFWLESDTKKKICFKIKNIRMRKTKAKNLQKKKFIFDVNATRLKKEKTTQQNHRDASEHRRKQN